MNKKVKCLIYCTKSKPYLSKEIIDPPFIENEFCLNARQNIDYNRVLNGKIVAQFDCEKVEKIRMLQDSNMTYETKTLTENQLLTKSCLEDYQLGNYLNILHEDECAYAIHISNLEIFNEPKELAKHTLDNNSDFYIKKWIKKFDSFKGSALTKPPQNMFNVYDKDGNHYILISIRPEWVCKILNGEKTIEVRKQVLNNLKELI